MRRLLATAFVATLAFSACGGNDAEPKSDGTTTTAAEADPAVGAAQDASTHEGMEHGDGETVVVDDKGLGMLKNGHHETMVYQDLSAEDQAELDKLLEITRETGAQWPTLGDFKAAGANRAGPFSPGLGIHYTLITGESFNPDGVMDETDLRNPLVVIYDGTTDDAKVAGFMYYSASKEQPEGFPGPNDFWHYHTDICNATAPNGEPAAIAADGSMTAEECAAQGGSLMSETQWMVHVWSIPGYEVDEADGGVFAEVNPKLTCPDGTYFIMPKDELINHPESACRSELDK